MNVDFENHGYLNIKFFSASFTYRIPVCSDTSLDVWRRLASDDTPSISIFASHLMSLPSTTHDVELIKKDFDTIIFRSPVGCFPEHFNSGGETRIPFVYCKDALVKVVEHLEK